MSTFTVQTECGTNRTFDSRREAEEGAETHVDLCEECSEDDVRILPSAAPAAGAPGTHWDDAEDRPETPLTAVEAGAAGGASGDGDDQADVEALAENVAETTDVDVDPGELADATDVAALPDDLAGVRTDPLDVVPGYMIDEVESQPTINKRGYAVIASQFDIAVRSEPITPAGETDHEYAEFRAEAWRKEDGHEHVYTGTATARADEDRRGIEHNLNEVAETRAMKRAVAWASGVGILAWEEMTQHLDEE